MEEEREANVEAEEDEEEEEVKEEEEEGHGVEEGEVIWQVADAENVDEEVGDNEQAGVEGRGIIFLGLPLFGAAPVLE